MAAKSVQAASRERLGRFQEHPESLQRRLRTPEKAPRSTRERAEATRIDAKSCPGTKNSSFSREARARSSIAVIFRRNLAILGLSAKSATLESTAPANKNEGSAVRATSRVARAMYPRKTTKIRIIINAKASKSPAFPEISAFPGLPGSPEAPEFPASPEFSDFSA